MAGGKNITEESLCFGSYVGLYGRWVIKNVGVSPLTLSRRQTKVSIFGQVERRNSWMLYWHHNSQNHASHTSIMTLILTLCHKSICTSLESAMLGLHSESLWMGRLYGASQHLGLRLCISMIGISTTYCKEPNNYPPKRCCMSATTIILTQCSKSMHRWNPICMGFIMSHFDGHVAWGNIAFWYNNCT